MAAVRITSGPLRGVELSTAARTPAGRALRRLRRKAPGRAPVLTPVPVEGPGVLHPRS